MVKKIIKYRRPYSICISSEGTIYTLNSSPYFNVFKILKSGKYFTFSFKTLNIKNPKSINIIESGQIIINDQDQLIVFNSEFKLINSIKLNNFYYSKKIIIKNKNLFIIDNQRKFLLNFSFKSNTWKKIFNLSFIKEETFFDSFFLKKNKFYLINKLTSEVYVIDITNSNFIKILCGFGREGKGKFREPSDINYLDHHIIINDNKNYLIQVFDEDMNFKSQIGGKGSLNYKFDLPTSSYIYNEKIYIADKNNDRIVSVNLSLSNFKLVVQDLFIDGSLRRPSGITLDKNFNIFISDRSNGVVQLFDRNLNFLKYLSTKKLYKPSCIAFLNYDNEDYLAIIERKNNNRSVLNIYKKKDKNFNFQLITKKILKDLCLKDSQDMVAYNDNLYIADTLNRRILILNIFENKSSEIDMVAQSGNERILIKTVFVKKDLSIFTADFEKCIIYQFDVNHTLIKKVNLKNYFNEIKVIRSIYANENNIIICVRGKNQILVLDYFGEIVKKIYSNFDSFINWNHPVKIINYKNKGLLILDKENDRVVSLDKNFNFLQSI